MNTNTEILLCYKNWKIGKLTFNGETYFYNSLPDKQDFLKQYGYLDFNLAQVESQSFKEMPYFFAEFVNKLLHNVDLSSKLNINLNKDSYFDILYRYAKLPQVKNAFYFCPQ